MVAEGGAGGLAAAARARRSVAARGVGGGGKVNDAVETSDIELDEATWTATGGEQGEELTVELLMRVVADIGPSVCPTRGNRPSSKRYARRRKLRRTRPPRLPNLGVVRPAEKPLPDPNDPMDFSAYDDSATRQRTGVGGSSRLSRRAQGPRPRPRVPQAPPPHARHVVVVDAEVKTPWATTPSCARSSDCKPRVRHPTAHPRAEQDGPRVGGASHGGASRGRGGAGRGAAGAAPIAVVPVSAARGDGVDALVRELGKPCGEEDDARVREIKRDARAANYR